MKNQSKTCRDHVAQALYVDLVGPTEQASTEVLDARPTRRYSTGILYPLETPMEHEEDEDGGEAANDVGDSTESLQGPPLYATHKPSSCGLSFAVRPTSGEPPVIRVDASAAEYAQGDEQGDGTEEAAGRSRKAERWQRIPLAAAREVNLVEGSHRLSLDEGDLDQQGMPGAELFLLVRRRGDLLTVTAALSNVRKRGDSRAFDETQHLFQAKLSVVPVSGAEFAPRPSRRAESDDDSRAAGLIYREAQEYVVGHTSSASAALDNGQVQALATCWTPSAIVPDVSDRGDEAFHELVEAEESPLSARRMAAADPETLEKATRSLVTAYRDWITKQERDRLPSLPPEFKAQGRLHLAACRQGADRMDRSIDLLTSSSDVRAAFQLAQKAMDMQFGWSRSGEELTWRPFQLGFQLLVLDSLAHREHPDRSVLDLLWFPTGGGKTEAYLALTAFVILLRRIRDEAGEEGGGRGVAVLMRYTLRLLTTQQFQRAASVIVACEILRRRDSSGMLGEKPIGIGLWVGKDATPLTLKAACDRSDGDLSDPRQLLECPACQQRLDWKITRAKSTVSCPSLPEDCDFRRVGQHLPVWTIDEEIYREAPALVIGTADKFAQIVRKPETGVLFGRGREAYPPDLIIQDELHLISGPLGSLAGLYEAAIDILCTSDGKRPKIVGSTATIRRAKDQVSALFDRDTYQFPAPGLDASNSGFAKTLDVSDDAPGRLYTGVTTAGRSATYMLQALAASLLQSASRPDDPAEKDLYWTLVIYFNSLRELGRALILMQDDVPVSIQQIAARRGEQARRVGSPAELTSRVPNYEIRDMLDQLKKRAGDSEAVDLLLASNMISVGMDIPRLGIMLVNSQPKSLSEYIQATSRVGRGIPGLVVTMYNAMRARDQSHYETFETWHQSLYRDVEATSVTPFASRAQDKALHAVLVALARHMVPELQTHPVLDVHARRKVEELAALIEQRVARVDPDERQQVAQKLTDLLDQWEDRDDLQTYWADYGKKISLLMSAEQYAAKVAGGAGEGGGRPRALWPTPNSLREVEAGSPFTLRFSLTAGGGQDA